MRELRRDLLLLAALCAVVYGVGLTTHGLTNWQEAQRVVVAREMQARGEWIVPTINGQPYLAKPPMMYWWQLGLAKVFGRELGIFELRLTVALAGLLGVLATYVVARRMFGRDVALWSSLALATGVLYVRSSRIGELDILLVPFVVTAVGAIHAAWERQRRDGRTAWGAVALAAVAAVGAALTKGPPGVLVIALAGYGGMALWAARGSDAGAAGRVPRVVGAIAGAAFAATGAFVAHRDCERLDLGLVCGVMWLAVFGYGCGWALGPLVARSRLASLWRLFARTHPVFVLGLPALALWGWGRWAATRIGGGAAESFAHQEAEDNLRLFVAGAPATNLEAAAYGVGLGSAAAVAAVIWIWKETRRPRRSGALPRTPAWFMVLAWVGLGLVAFSILGKGVMRYLTPVWPGMAILGGVWIAELVRTAKLPRGVRRGLAVAVVALAAGQAWWYGYGRDRGEGAHRSPRDLVGELLSASAPEAVRTRSEDLATFEFRTPAVDYYAGRFVQPIGEIGQRDSIAGARPWTMEDLRQHLAVTGRPMTLLVRQGKLDPTERLALAGLVVQTLPVRSKFTLDNGRTGVGAVRVSLAR